MESRSTSDDLTHRIQSVIAGTFDVPPESITNDTVAQDIDGWDSLSHTILMIRLQNNLGIKIPEEVAGAVDNVGDLVRAIRKICKGNQP